MVYTKSIFCYTNFWTSGRVIYFSWQLVDVQITLLWSECVAYCSSSFSYTINLQDSSVASSIIIIKMLPIWCSLRRKENDSLYDKDKPCSLSSCCFFKVSGTINLARYQRLFFKQWLWLYYIAQFSAKSRISKRSLRVWYTRLLSPKRKASFRKQSLMPTTKRTQVFFTVFCVQNLSPRSSCVSGWTNPILHIRRADPSLCCTARAVYASPLSFSWLQDHPPSQNSESISYI